MIQLMRVEAEGHWISRLCPHAMQRLNLAGSNL